MRRFTLHQRVRVKLEHFDLDGKTGRVVRIVKSAVGALVADGAWVAMDDPLPVDMRKFPEGDPHGREDHLVLYPTECVEIPEDES